jgi:hypothetical protein
LADSLIVAKTRYSNIDLLTVPRTITMHIVLRSIWSGSEKTGNHVIASAKEAMIKKINPYDVVSSPIIILIIIKREVDIRSLADLTPLLIFYI